MGISYVNKSSQKFLRFRSWKGFVSNNSDLLKAVKWFKGMWGIC